MNLNIGDTCYTVSASQGKYHITPHKVVGLIQHEGEIYPLIDWNLTKVPREGYDIDTEGFIKDDPFYVNYHVTLDLVKHSTTEQAEAAGVRLVATSKRIAEMARKDLNERNQTSL